MRKIKDILKITDAELQIMQVLWEKSYLTLGEVVNILDNNKSWSKTTVRTLIGRLMEKGFIGADKSEYYFKFYPMVTEQECKKDITESFLKKTFGGSLSMMVATLIRDSKIEEKEILELKKMIDKMEK